MQSQLQLQFEFTDPSSAARDIVFDGAKYCPAESSASLRQKLQIQQDLNIATDVQTAQRCQEHLAQLAAAARPDSEAAKSALLQQLRRDAQSAQSQLAQLREPAQPQQFNLAQPVAPAVQPIAPAPPKPITSCPPESVLQLKQSISAFTDNESKLAAALTDYAKDPAFNAETFGNAAYSAINAVHNSLLRTRNFDVLSNVRKPKAFAVELKASSSDNGLLDAGRCGSSTFQNYFWFGALGNEELVRYDFASTYCPYGKEQYNSQTQADNPGPFQVKYDKWDKEPELNDQGGQDSEYEERYSNFTDAILRFERSLAYCEGFWAKAVPALKQVAQSLPNNKASQFINAFGDDYTPVRIFKALKQLIQKLNGIWKLQEAEAMLKDNEYDLETLRKRPNMQVVDRIFAMQKLVKEYVAKAEKTQGEAKVDLELQKKQQAEQERIAQAQKKFEQDKATYDEALAKHQREQATYQQAVATYNQQRNVLMQKVDALSQQHIDLQVSQLDARERADLKRLQDQKKADFMNQAEAARLQEISRLTKLIVEIEEHARFRFQLRNQMIVSELLGERLVLEKDGSSYSEKNGVAQLVEQMKVTTAQKELVRSVRILYRGEDEVCCLESAHQAYTLDEVRQHTDEFDTGDETDDVDDPDKLEPSTAKLEIQAGQKTLRSAEELVMHYMQDHVCLLLELPVNDVLSPYVRRSVFPRLQRHYECLVLGSSSTTVTLLLANHLNYAKTRMQYQRQEVQFVAKPLTLAMHLLGKNERLSVTNASDPVMSRYHGDTMQLDYGCTPEDVIYTISKYGKGLERDLLNSSEQDYRKWQHVHQIGRLAHRYVSFTVRSEELSKVVKVFQMQEKYKVNDTGKWVTIAVGGEMFAGVAGRERDKLDDGGNQIHANGLRGDLNEVKYIQFRELGAQRKLSVRTELEKARAVLEKIEDDPKQPEIGIQMKTDEVNEDGDDLDAGPTIDDQLDQMKKIMQVLKISNDLSNIEKAAQKGMKTHLLQFIEDVLEIM